MRKFLLQLFRSSSSSSPSLLQCLMLAMNFDNFTLNFIRLVSVSLRHTEATQHDSQKHLWLNCTSQFGLARCSTRTGLAFIVDYEEESHAQSTSFAISLSLSLFAPLHLACFILLYAALNITSLFRYWYAAGSSSYPLELMVADVGSKLVGVRSGEGLCMWFTD